MKLYHSLLLELRYLYMQLNVLSKFYTLYATRRGFLEAQAIPKLILSMAIYLHRSRYHFPILVVTVKRVTQVIQAR